MRFALTLTAVLALIGMGEYLQLPEDSLAVTTFDSWGKLLLLVGVIMAFLEDVASIEGKNHDVNLVVKNDKIKHDIKEVREE